RGLRAVADYRGRLFSDRVGFRRGALLRSRDGKTSLAGTHGRTTRVARFCEWSGLFPQRQWRDAGRETRPGISIDRAERAWRKMFPVTRDQRWKYFNSRGKTFVLHRRIKTTKRTFVSPQIEP